MSRETEIDGGKKKGSGYIEFSDEDPVDRAVLVGVHNVQKAVLEVESGPKQMAAGGSKKQARAAEDKWYPRERNTGEPATKGAKVRIQRRTGNYRSRGVQK